METYRVIYRNRFTGTGTKWVTYMTRLGKRAAAAVRARLEREGWGQVEIEREP